MVFNYERKMLRVLSQVKINYLMLLCDAKFTSLGQYNYGILKCILFWVFHALLFLVETPARKTSLYRCENRIIILTCWCTKITVK